MLNKPMFNQIVNAISGEVCPEKNKNEYIPFTHGKFQKIIKGVKPRYKQREKAQNILKRRLKACI